MFSYVTFILITMRSQARAHWIRLLLLRSIENFETSFAIGVVSFKMFREMGQEKEPNLKLDHKQGVPLHSHHSASWPSVWFVRSRQELSPMRRKATSILAKIVHNLPSEEDCFPSCSWQTFIFQPSKGI